MRIQKAITLILEVLEKAKHKDGRFWKDYAIVTNSEAKKIYSIVGINVSSYKRVIVADAILHILNKHGEKTNDPIPINEADILLIPYIISTADTIERGKKAKSSLLTTIIYTKLIDDYFVVIEEIRTRRKKLSVKTMYKKPAKK